MRLDFPREKTLGFGCSAGSLPAWCYAELHVPGFDLEISAEADPEAYELCKSDRTQQELLARYQKLHTQGLRSVLELVAGR